MPQVAGPSSLVISSGGIYTGAWESQDPTMAAVVINTSDPVVLENCTIRSKGDLVYVAIEGARVTIRNCQGYGLDPNIPGRVRGDFFFAYRIGSLTIEHNYMEAVSFGVRLYSQNGWRPSGPIVVRYNQAKNLDGVPSNGAGGRDVSHLQFGQDNGNHFVILANLQSLGGTEIAWNEILSEPGTSSVGDVISIYSSSGTAESPILIHDNYIQGGYAATPTATSYTAGGITMDGSSMDSTATATAFARIYENQVVNHPNFAVGLAAGHDNEAYGNRAVSSGRLVDGTWVATTYGSGIYVWNCTCYSQPSSVYFNNFAHGNQVGWVIEGEDPQHPGTRIPPPIRNDYYLPDCEGGPSGPASRCVENQRLDDPVTSATEAGERAIWIQKLQANCVTVGPLRGSDRTSLGPCSLRHSGTSILLPFR